MYGDDDVDDDFDGCDNGGDGECWWCCGMCESYVDVEGEIKRIKGGDDGNSFVKVFKYSYMWWRWWWWWWWWYVDDGDDGGWWISWWW